MDGRQRGWLYPHAAARQTGRDQRALVQRAPDARRDAGKGRQGCPGCGDPPQTGRPGCRQLRQDILERRRRLSVRCGPGQQPRRQHPTEPDFRRQPALLTARQDATARCARRRHATSLDAVRTAHSFGQTREVLRPLHRQPLAARLRLSSGDRLAVAHWTVLRRLRQSQRTQTSPAQGHRRLHPRPDRAS